MASAQSEDPVLKRIFRGHQDGATCVDFNPNLEQLASGGLDNAVMLWNLRKNQRAFRLEGHKGAVTSLSYSRTGFLLASVSRDRTVRLWTPSIKGKFSSCYPHTKGVTSVNFSPDDRKILTASEDKTVKLWEVVKLRFSVSMSDHSNCVRSARFSNDGRLVVSGSDDRTMKLWDPSSKTTLHTFSEHPGAVMSVAFHPTDLWIAAAAANHVYIYDVRTRDIVQEYVCDSEIVRTLVFHPSGRYLLTGSDDAAFRIFDVYKGRLYYTLHKHSAGVQGVSFSKSGDEFATAGLDKLVTIWKTNLDKEELPIDQAVISERMDTTNHSLREIDVSMIPDEDIEVNVNTAEETIVQSPDGGDSDTSEMLSTIRSLSRQVQSLTSRVSDLEKRLDERPSSE